MKKKNRVCYLTSHSPVFNKEVGGAEAQLYLIGKELLKCGWESHYVINDSGQRNTDVIDGLVFHKLKRPSDPLRKFIKKIATKEKLSESPLIYFKSLLSRTLLNTISILDYDTFEKTDADIYHTRCSGRHVGYISSFAKMKDKPFVFSVAHIDDCTLKGVMWRNRGWLEKRSYLKGLKRADSVIITSEYLRDPLEKIYSGEIRHIPSGYPIPKKIDDSDKKYVLWVSRMTDWKHPEKFFELAKSLPEYEFVMVGGGSCFKKFEEFKDWDGISKIKNLEFVDFVPFNKINEYFMKAALFVDTSDSAGFPNTFIQAWMHAVPTVGLQVDPDCVICKNKLGFHSKTMSQMTEDVRELLENSSLRAKMSANARKYAVKNHDIKETASKHNDLYHGLIENG